MVRFRNIIGQDRAIEAIVRAFRGERLPHGLIFAGPSGVGKATTATALGTLFLCDRPADIESCGQCASCTLIDAGNHPDYHVITKELIRYHDKTGTSKGIDLSIHVIRPELVEPANRKPGMGQGKVFVIRQAELMNPQAQNAMLKTLEEPAGRTLIILLTDQPDILLPTIRSRCQLVRFAPLDRAIVESELEKRGLDAAGARQAAECADGSLGLAWKWSREGVIDRARELSAMVEALLSGRDVGDLPAWFKSAAEAYAEKQLERDSLASKDQANREGLGLYLQLAGHTLQRRLAATADPEQLDRLCAGIEALAAAEQHIDANVNIPLALRQLAVRLNASRPVTDPVVSSR